jgi:aminopeptidase
MQISFETALDTYAEMAVKSSLNIQPGQRLVILSPIESTKFVHALAKHAYRLGCRLIQVIYRDDQMRLLRHQFAPRDSFEEFPNWHRVALEDALDSGDAIISVTTRNPDLLKNQDPELVALEEKTTYAGLARAYELLGKNTVNWLVVGPPIPSWADEVFPNLPKKERMPRLWQEIFKVSRVYEEEPIKAWETHIDHLEARRAYLNAKKFGSLHFKSPHTDLHIGLPDGHIWYGGSAISANGIRFVPNMPTEEVFTLPHRERVNGVVHSTKAFTFAGNLIDDFELVFRDGCVVDCKAAKGERMLRKIIETDEGSSRLGEVALVPNSSPISQAGFRFKSTLYDENAASHLALGRAYRFTLENGKGMDEIAFKTAGGNYSLLHEDFMIGDSDTDLDGITQDGERESLMGSGEWAFEI